MTVSYCLRASQQHLRHAPGLEHKQECVEQYDAELESDAEDTPSEASWTSVD